MTVWETDSLDSRWVDWCNEVDKVIVPCKHNKKVFEKCKVKKPIEIIPHIGNYYKKPISLKLVEKTISNLGIKPNDFVFYTIGQWSERKGIEDTIIAYLNSFTNKDNTCLIVKTFKSNYSKEEKNKIRILVNSILRKYINPAKVILILDELTEEEINILHSIGHCYISLCKAEGWGLGVFDAISFQKSILITGYGGQTDFVEKSFQIPFTMTPVKNMEWIPWYNSEQQWAKPNVEKASEMIKNIKKSYEEKDIDFINTLFKNYIYCKNSFNSKLVIEKLIKFLNK